MGKKSAPPPPPDYSALALQQAALDKAAAGEQTVANRPNQITPFGNETWSQNPAGEWTQTSTLNPADQKLLDQERAFQSQQQGIASGLLDKAGDSLSQPLDLSTLPDLKDFDFSKLSAGGNIDLSALPDLAGLNKMDPGFGAVQEVQDAMMGRLAPSRAQLRDSEIQRLKNQGLSENSEAFQRAMTRLNQGDTDASQQALLGAVDAYGDIFNRGLAQNQQLLGQRDQAFGEQNTKAAFDNALRAQQLGEQSQATQLAGMLRQQSLAEQQQLRQSPLDDFMKLTQGINPQMPNMPSFMAGTGYNAADMQGAAKDQYQAALDADNAKKAGLGGLMGGIGSLAGTALTVF